MAVFAVDVAIMICYYFYVGALHSGSWATEKFISAQTLRQNSRQKYTFNTVSSCFDTRL